MHHLNYFKESLRSGTIAALAMMPFGFVFKLLDLRVGYYGPKFGALLFGEPNRFVLFLQHLVLGWVSALPLLWILVRWHGKAAPLAVGAAYGLAYYVLVNSLALPLYFGDATPWQLGLSFIYPSALVHLVFGVCIAATSRKFVARELASGSPGTPGP